MEEFFVSLAQNPGHIWLMAGAVLVVVEMLLMPGAGFLFAGLAAFSVGVGVEMEWIDATSTLSQLAVFLVMTGVWAAVLWQPLKKWLNKTTEEPYHNIVGNHAMVEAPGLSKNKRGHVRWSDVSMKARLDEECARDHLDEGTEVVITAIKGTTLTVTLDVKPRRQNV